MIECHLARNASLGQGMPEMAYCPLTIPGVTARVTSTGNGFGVAIRAEDPDVALEVLRRAQQLTLGPAGPQGRAPEPSPQSRARPTRRLAHWINVILQEPTA